MPFHRKLKASDIFLKPKNSTGKFGQERPQNPVSQLSLQTVSAEISQLKTRFQISLKPIIVGRKFLVNPAFWDSADENPLIEISFKTIQLPKLPRFNKYLKPQL